MARRFEETFGAAIHEGYGLTEMSGLATTFALGRRRKAGSVGRPSSGTEMRIANADERGVGEVQFRGPSAIRGYWNDPEATAAAIDRTAGSRPVTSATSTRTATSSSSTARRR